MELCPCFAQICTQSIVLCGKVLLMRKYLRYHPTGSVHARNIHIQYFHLNLCKLYDGPIRLLADHDFTVRCIQVESITRGRWIVPLLKCMYVRTCVYESKGEKCCKFFVHV